MYVQDTIYDQFLAILVGKANELVISHGFDEKAGGGPVVSHLRFCLPVSLCYPGAHSHSRMSMYASNEPLMLALEWCRLLHALHLCCLVSHAVQGKHLEGR